MLEEETVTYWGLPTEAAILVLVEKVGCPDTELNESLAGCWGDAGDCIS
jgi:hypothetical protein